MKNVVIMLNLLLLAGCSQMNGKKAFVTVDVVNATAKPLDWVRVVSDDRQLFSAGILIAHAETTSLDYVWKHMPEQAHVTFVDEQTRRPYSIAISLTEANGHVLSGRCKRVTIRILTYDTAEVVCK